jgi:hypothetical protein
VINVDQESGADAKMWEQVAGGEQKVLSRGTHSVGEVPRSILINVSCEV